MATFEDVVSSYPDKVITGYKFDSDTAPLTITEVAADNVIEVYYETRSDLSYVVHYYLQDTTTEVAPDKEVPNNYFRALVTENAISVPGYTAVGATTKTLILELIDTEIVFYYVPMSTAIRHSVTYYDTYRTSGNVPVDTRSPYVDGSTVIILDQGSMLKDGHVFLGWDTSSDADTVVYETDDSFQIIESLALYAVWQPEPGDVMVPYTVHYYIQGTTTSLVNSKTGTGIRSTSITETAPAVTGYNIVAPSTVTAALNATHNVIIFNYTPRNDISYVVNYLEQGTNRVLATQKVVNNQVFNTSITENAITISGYNANVASITARLNATNNVFNFYYTAANSGGGGGSSSGSGSSTPRPAPSKPAPPPETKLPEDPYEPIDEPIDEPIEVWALANLILSVVGLVLAIIMLVLALLLTRKQKQNAKGQKLQLKRKDIWLIITLAMGIAGIIVFLLTQNMDNVRVWFDKWTIVNVIIFVVEIIAITLLFAYEKITVNKEEKPSSK
jgi:hypothetical protein